MNEYRATFQPVVDRTYRISQPNIAPPCKSKYHKAKLPNHLNPKRFTYRLTHICAFTLASRQASSNPNTQHGPLKKTQTHAKHWRLSCRQFCSALLCMWHKITNVIHNNIYQLCVEHCGPNATSTEAETATTCFSPLRFGPWVRFWVLRKSR